MSPALGNDCEVDSEVKKPLLHDLFDLLGLPVCNTGLSLFKIWTSGGPIAADNENDEAYCDSKFFQTRCSKRRCRVNSDSVTFVDVCPGTREMVKNYLLSGRKKKNKNCRRRKRNRSIFRQFLVTKSIATSFSFSKLISFDTQRPKIVTLLVPVTIPYSRKKHFVEVSMGPQKTTIIPVPSFGTTEKTGAIQVPEKAAGSEYIRLFLTNCRKLRNFHKRMFIRQGLGEPRKKSRTAFFAYKSKFSVPQN